MKIPCLSALALLCALGVSPALAQDDAPPATIPTSPATYNETRLSALEDQMRGLNGRLEQVEYDMHRIDQALQRMQTDTEARLTKLETAQTAAAAAVTAPVAATAPIPLTQQPVAPQQPPAAAANSPPAPAVAAPDGTLGALKLQNGQVVGGTVNPQAPSLPTPPPDYGLTTQEQYDRAFDMLRQANYADAGQAFKTFIDKNPRDKLIDSAKYWYGETLYVRAEFDAAAVAFADAYQQNPNGAKAPDSLLKLAMSLGALNKTPDACVTLNELKSKYPNAAATIKARAAEERHHLKCPAH